MALIPVFFLIAVQALGAGLSPAGLWRTVDDRTHAPRGTVRIYAQNGIFSGKIESSFDPKDRTEVCSDCRDDRRNHAIIGLEILRGIVKHGGEYSGGSILDPDTGQIYRCKFTLSADGETLFMRGYLGLSLLGRSQIWTRVPENK